MHSFIFLPIRDGERAFVFSASHQERAAVGDTSVASTLLFAFCFVFLGRRPGLIEKPWALVSVRFGFQFWLQYFLGASFALFLHL